jgi:hypothetical protein
MFLQWSDKWGDEEIKQDNEAIKWGNEAVKWGDEALYASMLQFLMSVKRFMASAL